MILRYSRRATLKWSTFWRCRRSATRKILSPGVGIVCVFFRLTLQVKDKDNSTLPDLLPLSGTQIPLPSKLQKSTLLLCKSWRHFGAENTIPKQHKTRPDLEGSGGATGKLFGATLSVTASWASSNEGAKRQSCWSPYRSDTTRFQKPTFKNIAKKIVARFFGAE